MPPKIMQHLHKTVFAPIHAGDALGLPLCATIEKFVSFRQACLNDFSRISTVVGFLKSEADHGETNAGRNSPVAGTRARSL